MLTSFRLDSRGVREILRGPGVRQVVDGLAGEVAGHVRALLPEAAPVEVRGYTTDRGAATIVVADARAMGWQAKDGILTRAAGAAGLEVKAWQR